MKSNTFKKITALTYLAIFLFGFFVPFNVSSLIKIEKNEARAMPVTINITATPNQVQRGAVSAINWSYTPTSGTVCFGSGGNGWEDWVAYSISGAPTVFYTGNILSTTTYNLRCINDIDSADASVTVTLKTPTITPPLTCTPPQKLNADKTACITSTDTTYTPLAKLPGLETKIDTNGSCPFGNYLNIIIKLVLGISAVLAMVMIVMGGIEYMSSELISSKEAGKESITHAVLGLLIALGAYLLLNTINPQLLNVCGIDKLPEAVIVINGPDAGDDTIDPDFAKKIYKYSTNASVSSGVTSAITKIKDGWEIVKFTVHTNNKMTIELKKGSQYNYDSVIDIAHGKNGYAPIGTGKSKDGKTPLGNWKIIENRYKPNIPQFNKEGSNMGAAFWHLDPMTSGERGIGMHGNKIGTLSSTNGCIRLKNSDILALQPYIKTGIIVSIKE
jgi:lipoprotein-anchoring transpeptidase ErfK/SrfK